MTGWRKRTIMEMAQEAGLAGKPMFKDGLEAFAAMVRADAIAEERDACAKVCDELPAPDIYSHTDKSMWDVTCMDCAAAIRARGKEPCVHEWIDDTKAKPAWRCIKCGSDYKKEQA